ncbi:hypothetical protein [Aeromonas veronii]|uniref:hypothetical protein n=1 Tax=Aeromonas veronii TaxID=654 RepID=UPI0039FA2E9F
MQKQKQKQKQKQYHHELSAVGRGVTIPDIRVLCAGVPVSATAQAIVVHRSTLYRERRRNAHQEGYLPIWRISKRTFI